MDAPTVVPVVLSGGSGTRLWPASRPDTPKQLLALVDHRTMLHATLDRVRDLPGRSEVIVVCGNVQTPVVLSELDAAGVDDALVIVEPAARNTAPAVAVAAQAARRAGNDPVLLVMPADHIIADVGAFHSAVATGLPAAVAGHLVTFGIVPDHPATGYGYIEVGSDEGMPPGVHRLTRFVEKPSRNHAEQLIAGGSFLWNSGMFLFRASVYLDELERCNGAIASAAERSIAAATGDADTLRLDGAAFEASPSDSVDYAVMEHTSNGAVVSLDAGWNDVGSWASLYDLADKDASGNVVVGDVIHHGVAGSYLRSDGPLLTVVGISNIVAVSTPDAVLVSHIDHTQDVRNIVARLKEAGRQESVRSRRTPASFGRSERLAVTSDRVVDELTLDPGKRVTVKADAIVVLEGQTAVQGATLDAGSATSVGGSEVTIENDGANPAVVLVVHEG